MTTSHSPSMVKPIQKAISIVFAQLETSGATTSNRISLSQADTRLAQRLLLETSTSLLEVQAELSRLQQLESEYHSQIQKLHIALSPQKKLYPDVLAKIFLFAAGENTLGLVIPPTRSSIPWNLLRVCAEWRRVALEDCPDLWRRAVFNVNLDGDSSDCCVKKINIAAGIIPTTHGPLSLTVNVDASSSKAGDFYRTAIPRILTPHLLAHTRNIHLRGPKPAYHALLLGMSTEVFKEMETVSLEFTEGPDPASFCTTKAFKESKLTSLKMAFSSSLEHTRLMTGLPRHPLIHWLPPAPWAKLIFIHLADAFQLDLTQALSILRNCSQLHTCALRILISSWDELPRTSISLPRLERFELVLDDHRTSTNHHFLNTLILPSLVDFRYEGSTFPIPELTELIRRSKCSSLKNISQTRYTLTTVPDTILVRFLSHIPSVENLQLIGVEFSVPVLVSLAHLVKNDSYYLLPHLKVFTCHTSSEIAIVAFLDLVNSRFEFIPPTPTPGQTLPLSLSGDLPQPPAAWYSIRTARFSAIVPHVTRSWSHDQFHDIIDNKRWDVGAVHVECAGIGGECGVRNPLGCSRFFRGVDIRSWTVGLGNGV